MRVIDINGRLQTAGTWEMAEHEDAVVAHRLLETRAGLRRMLDGNEAFHVDPMAAPAVSFTPTVIGIDGAGGPDTAAIVAYTRTGSAVRIDTVFSALAFPNVSSTGLPAALASTESASGAALIGIMNGPGDALIGFKREPEADVWHTEAPPVPGIYETWLPGRDSTRPLPSWWCGQQWHLRPVDPHCDPRKTDPCYGGGTALVWLRLIEADTPTPAAK